jgi:hypothetical protein
MLPTGHPGLAPGHLYLLEDADRLWLLRNATIIETCEMPSASTGAKRDSALTASPIVMNWRSTAALMIGWRR